MTNAYWIVTDATDRFSATCDARLTESERDIADELSAVRKQPLAVVAAQNTATGEKDITTKTRRVARSW